ncbi:MAG: hypothetical protein QME60_07140 [Verrucomicrobiota bacterium]|nr:hypothetical protein [Verrucomicrobiota bacterium]
MAGAPIALVDKRLEAASGFGEERIGFGTTLDRPWLGVVGAKRDEVGGEDFQETATEAVDGAERSSMEQLSRAFLFLALPDTRRRKPLSRKIMGLI